MDKLVYQTVPHVMLATNIFINVPVILKFEETNLIEVIEEAHLGFTTSIPIYHSDGTYLAKVRGTRIYPTAAGKKAGLEIDKRAEEWVCTMNKQTLFEIRHQPSDAFKVSAELYTPTGYFVKCPDAVLPEIIDPEGATLMIGGVRISGCTFSGGKIGIWLHKDGECLIGC
ncbi:MAG: hypothetical protein PHH77_00525 [Victivallaceae bacterium]|nr:hypothetical protein [Victivallaceae bacterium]